MHPGHGFLLGWQSSLKLSYGGGASHSCECTNRYWFEYLRKVCNNHYDQERRLGWSRAWSPSTQLLSGAFLKAPPLIMLSMIKRISFRTLKCTTETWPCCAEGSLSLSNSHSVTSMPLPWWLIFIGGGEACRNPTSLRPLVRLQPRDSAFSQAPQALGQP